VATQRPAKPSTPVRFRSSPLSTSAAPEGLAPRPREGKFSIAGEGLNIGKEGAEPVTDDYPGEYPWAFAGDAIKKAMIDVSGDPLVDLAQPDVFDDGPTKPVRI
jgi:hypothetical protein